MPDRYLLGRGGAWRLIYQQAGCEERAVGQGQPPTGAGGAKEGDEEGKRDPRGQSGAMEGNIGGQETPGDRACEGRQRGSKKNLGERMKVRIYKMYHYK